jgi:structural maintenance of chromosome 1
LTEDSNPLDQLPIDELVQGADPDAMDVDGTQGEGGDFAVQDYGIEVDFDSLGDTLKEVRSLTSDC